MPIFDDRIILDYDNPVPEDKDFSLAAINGGRVIVTVNEGRALAGFPALPEEEGGELFLMPQGVSLKDELAVAARPLRLGYLLDLQANSLPRSPTANPRRTRSRSPTRAASLVGRASSRARRNRSRWRRVTALPARG